MRLGYFTMPLHPPSRNDTRLGCVEALAAGSTAPHSSSVA
jgi:hypothetical protein